MVAGFRDDGDELGVPEVGVVERLRDDQTLEGDATSAFRGPALEPLKVRRSAYDQYGVGGFNPIFQPSLLAFFGRTIDVLVDGAIKAVPAQLVGQVEHPSAMLLGVVAGADGYLFHGAEGGL